MSKLRVKPSENIVQSMNLYNETLAEKLFNEVRILCWVATTVENHEKKAKFVKQTWGKRCNKLLFMSTKTDVELGTITLPVKDGRNTLWDKTKNAFLYVHKNHFNEADWFLKADDDK
jgi:glycoprotein-N-acetylgalactosamine 3-beta-galactosyltransferase